MRFIKENLIRLVVFISFSISALFILGCSDSTSPGDGQGLIKITMVDSPADFDHVNIVVTRVEVHKADSDSSSGWVVVNNNLATYDLLTLRNGASVVLGDNSLDVGRYTQIRLILGTGSNVVVNGTVFSLDVASGAQTGIKLNREFEIQEGLIYELLLDFDAQRSIILTGNGQYKLKPVIKVVPTIISGSISGKVNPLNAGASIYVMSGTDTVSSTLAESSSGSFKLMALLAGTYSVKVSPGNVIYNDTAIANVVVTAKQNTDLGTISLSLK
jgi:hypothetical protein